MNMHKTLWRESYWQCVGLEKNVTQCVLLLYILKVQSSKEGQVIVTATAPGFLPFSSSKFQGSAWNLGRINFFYVLTNSLFTNHHIIKQCITWATDSFSKQTRIITDFIFNQNAFCLTNSALFKKLIVTDLVKKNSSCFTEPYGSSPSTKHPIPSPITLVHTSPFHFLNIRFNIVLPSKIRSSKSSFPLGFPSETLCTLPPSPFHAFCPSSAFRSLLMRQVAWGGTQSFG